MVSHQDTTTGDPPTRSRFPRGVLLVASAGLLVASLVGFVRDDAPETDATGAAAAEGAVTIIDFAFDPETVTVAVGDPVMWTNQDEATHTVTSDGGGPLDSGDLAQDATYDAAFDEPGTYAYICTIHPTMQGTVEVTS